MEGMWWQLGWGSQDRNTQDTSSGQEAPSGKEKPGREVARKGNQHKMTQPAVLWDAACTARENKFLQQVYLPGEEGESETCSGVGGH